MSTQQPSVTQPSDEQPDDPSGSRRNFLSAGGATAVATGLGGRLQPAFAAEQPRRKVHVGIATMTRIVNRDITATVHDGSRAERPFALAGDIAERSFRFHWHFIE